MKKDTFLKQTYIENPGIEVNDKKDDIENQSHLDKLKSKIMNLTEKDKKQ